MQFNAARLANSACTPLTGAYLDVWHADAAGVYSDERMNRTSGKTCLRGFQVTDANRQANFTTSYPGWYSGRAAHIHFKRRLDAGSTTSYAFTSQVFFDDTLTDTVYTAAPYGSRRARDTRNASDGIYNSLTTAQKAASALSTTASITGYAGAINLDVAVG